MPGLPENLRLNSNVQDPFFIGGASRFSYKHWNTVRNYFKARQVISPKEVDSWTWSSTSITRNVEIEKLCEKITHLRLEMDVGALAVTPGAAAYLRFCDYLAYAMIESIEFKQNSNVIQRLTGDQLYLKNVKYMSAEQQDAENVCVAGRLSTSQRDYAATTTQHLILRIPFYFDDDVTKALTMHALGIEPKITIKFRPLTSVIQTDLALAGNTFTAAVSNVQMSAECVYLEPEERDSWLAILQQKHGLVSR